MADAQPPKDRRMRQMKRKIKKVGQDLTTINLFLQGLPKEIRDDVQQQLQRAFEAGAVFQEIQSMPQQLPMDAEGMIRIGPALRHHILETRKIYTEVDQLREIVSDIFEEKSQELLHKIVRDQEESTSITETTEITVNED